MKILITGGAGFQGSHLARSLLAKNHKVTILNTPSERALLNIKEILPKITLVWGSVTDPEIVEKTVREQDVVFHLAAYINVDESLLNPDRTITTNVLGTVNVLNSVRTHRNRLIYISSCEVYGDGHDGLKALSEKVELRPNSPYAASKAAADRICHAYYRSFDVNVTIVRPFNVYGPRQRAGRHGALIPILVQKAAAGENIAVFGDGKQTRDYLYIDDVIRAYNFVLRKQNLKGEVINFASGRETRIVDIAKYIALKFGVKVNYLPIRAGEVSHFKADLTFAKELGWKPRIDIWAGMDRYISWFGRNKSLI